MRIGKKLAQGMKHLDKIKQEMEEKLFSGEKPNIKEVSFDKRKALINKYMSMEEYIKMDIAYGINRVDWFDEDVPKALHLYKKIIDYKLSKQKNGKISNDPRNKAFIDFSDGLLRYEREDVKKIGSRRSPLYKSREHMEVHVRWGGKICLPFNKCLIYSCLPMNIAQIVEIDDNMDGTFKGTMWGSLAEDKLLRVDFTIIRYEDAWDMHFVMANFQKPLGQILNNVGVLINSAICRPEEDYMDLCKCNMLATEKLFVDFVMGILPVMAYMESYKSKKLYKLQKDSSNIYVYSDSDNENVFDYIREHYPNYSYNELEGWLINGYWKILPENTMGKDRDGKLIKGLDWIIPYKDSITDVAISNEQVTNLVPIHALQRAKERYNLDLSTDDLQNISNEILAGRNVSQLSIRDKFGRIYMPKDKKGCYRLKYKNRYMDVVVDNTDSKQFRVATFLPEPKDVTFNIIDSKDYNTVLEDSLK